MFFDILFLVPVFFGGVLSRNQHFFCPCVYFARQFKSKLNKYDILTARSITAR